MTKTRSLPFLLLAVLLLAEPALGQGWSAPIPEEEKEEAGVRLEEGLTGDSLAERIEAIDAERKRRRSLEDNGLRPRISRYMERAIELIDQDQTAEARKVLDDLDMARLNQHERAMIYRLKAFVAYTAGDAGAAVQAFHASIDEEILPIQDETRMRFNIGQLHASQQEWKESLAALEEWVRWEVEPDPLGYYLMAIDHFQLEEIDAAIADAETAIDMSAEPKEGWLQLLAALFVQKEDYASTAPVLEELVLRYPKQRYWVQLSLIYGAKEEYKRSLAVQQVAYAQGLLVEDAELRRLARSYLHAELPYRAAVVLEEGLEEGAIEKDKEAYEMLANSWIASREYDRSLGPLRQAAELSEDGNLFVRLGQVYLQREEWSRAAEALDRGVAKGELKNPGNALLLLGISNYNDEQVGTARAFFQRARQHEETRPQAESWLKHLDTEAEQQASGSEGGGGLAPVG